MYTNTFKTQMELLNRFTEQLHKVPVLILAGHRSDPTVEAVSKEIVISCSCSTLLDVRVNGCRTYTACRYTNAAARTYQILLLHVSTSTSITRCSWLVL